MKNTLPTTGLEFWSLGFVCDLEFVVWNFQPTSQAHGWAVF